MKQSYFKDNPCSKEEELWDHNETIQLSCQKNVLKVDKYQVLFEKE